MKNKITLYGIILFSGLLLSCGTQTNPLAHPQQREVKRLPLITRTPLKSKFLLSTKRDGITWQRHIMQEPYGERTLLLVIDEPLDNNLKQHVRLRRSFAPTEHSKMQELIAQYSDRNAQAPELSEVAVKTDNPLWPIVRQWTAEEEKLYNAWIVEHSNPDFITGSGLVVDCADYAMTLRWIYAHDRGLPAANSLGGSAKLFGSWESTVAWDRLPTAESWRDDERFKAALMYLLDNAFTQTIVNDLYPLKLDPEFIGPGTVYLTLWGASGHTRTIIHIGENQYCSSGKKCVVVIYGNEPARDVAFITDEFPYQQKEGDGGLLRFRWPVFRDQRWSLAPAPSMPGYSREQFKLESFEFVKAFAEKLGLWVTAEERALGLTSAILSSLQTRLQVTINGYIVCSLVPCEPGTPLYDEFSTPSRDHRLKTNIAYVRAALNEADPNDPDLSSTLGWMKLYEIMPGFGRTWYDVIVTLDLNGFTSDPRDEFFVRWNLTDIDLKNKLLMLNNIAYYALNTRQNLVETAQAACQPTESGDSCDHNAPEIAQLNTSRLDQGLRLFQTRFLGDFESLTRNDQFDVVEMLAQFSPYVYLCGPKQNEYCTNYDLLLNQPELLQQMTSEPWDLLKHRWGVF